MSPIFNRYTRPTNNYYFVYNISLIEVIKPIVHAYHVYGNQTSEGEKDTQQNVQVCS